MIAPIGPGDYVECIDAGAPAFCLTERAIYQVEAVEPPSEARCYRDGCSGHDIKVYGAALYWCAGRFRPVYRRNADLIRQLGQPAPDAVRELEEVA